MKETTIDTKEYAKVFILNLPAERRSECFKEIVDEMYELYRRKNHDYGNSFAILRSRREDSILVRIFDKYLRLETLIGGKKAEVKDESIEDTLRDIANYCVMELIERRLEKEAEELFK